MDAKTRLLFWLLNATKGGPTRVKVLRNLNKTPMNIRQLALSIDMDYKTVQAHIGLLMKNEILDMQGNGYGAIYFVSTEWEDNDYLKKMIGGNKNGKKRKG
ncbi:MAG: winged helix-turn-helix domain-containing protein [Candidatus Micrarchaeota archaeon]